MQSYYDRWEENEYWVDLNKYPKYQISTYGRIRNKNTGKILKTHIDKYGYSVININGDNRFIHRLMAETFYGEPTSKQMQVNHFDCNRSNNHILNLEWCTPRENIIWGIRNGNIDPSKGLKKAVEINKKPVRIVETGQIFASVKDCAEYLGASATNISSVLKGKRKGQRVHGYHIEYVREEEL